MTSKHDQDSNAPLDDAIVERIHALLDDELCPIEIAEVERLMADSQPAQQLYEELKSLKDWMADAPEVAPSVELRSRLQKLAQSHARQVQVAPRVRRRGAWLPTAHWMRAGYAFSLAAVMAVGLYQFGPGHQFGAGGDLSGQESQLVGSLMPASETANTANGANGANGAKDAEPQAIQLRSPVMEGEIMLYRYATSETLEFDLKLSEAAEIRMLLPPDLSWPADSPSEYTQTGQTVKVAVSGDWSDSLQFNKSASITGAYEPIRVEVWVQDRMQDEHAIPR